MPELSSIINWDKRTRKDLETSGYIVRCARCKIWPVPLIVWEFKCWMDSNIEIIMYSTCSFHLQMLVHILLMWTIDICRRQMRQSKIWFDDICTKLERNTQLSSFNCTQLNVHLTAERILISAISNCPWFNSADWFCDSNVFGTFCGSLQWLASHRWGRISRHSTSLAERARSISRMQRGEEDFLYLAIFSVLALFCLLALLKLINI